MKRTIRIIQFFWILLFNKIRRKSGFESYPYQEIEDREKKSRTKRPILKILGSLYHQYTSLREKDRVWTYNLEREKNKHNILLELLKHSKSIIIYLIVAISLSSFLDWLFWFTLPAIRNNYTIVGYFTIPSSDFISIGLEIFVGAISAILGLIFALYTVGFQLSTDRYSEKVTDFINQESVSNYFFGLLIFTDLFSISILLELHFFSTLPIVSFLIAAILVIFSILGILIFKNHYINSLKPINLLQSLWRLCKEQLDIATNLRGYKYKSWSLATYAKKFSNRYLDIIGNLYRDLKRDGNWNDAVITPLILGEILRDYTDVKRFIDKEKGWWFFQRYEKVKADNLAMFTIKANYELQGKGPLHIPKSAEDWYEVKIYEFLDEMLEDVDKDNTDRLLANLSTAYGRILVGDYQKQTDAPPKLIPGAIQNQEFDLFNKGFERFMGLWKKVDFTKISEVSEFVNSYFDISIGVLDEWNIDKAIEIAKSFYVDDQLNSSKEFIYLKDLPTFSRAILINYWERLEVEQELEGQLITPIESFTAEIQDVLKEKRREIINKYLTILFDNSNQIIIDLFQKNQLEHVGQFIKMQYEWISRLLYLRENELAESFAPKLRQNTGYILYLPKNIVVDLELLEQAEKGYFVSLIERRKELFEVYSKIIVFVMLILRDNEKDKDELVKLIRLPVIWGSLAFLVSELDQEPFYVCTFIKDLEKTYRTGFMAQIIETAADLKLTNNIFWETTRYHSWYRMVLNTMADTLRKIPVSELGEIGFRESYDHPSKFIQKLGMWELMEEELTIEEFVEWVKKREEVKRLISILIQLRKNKYV